MLKLINNSNVNSNLIVCGLFHIKISSFIYPNFIKTFLPFFFPCFLPELVADSWKEEKESCASSANELDPHAEAPL